MAAPSQPSPYADAPSANQTVQNSLDFFLNPNSDYIQNARQRGVEYAASRGGLNSSIAAGASERSALEAVMPLVQQSQEVQKTRDALAGQDWLDTQAFNREFQGQLAMLPVVNSYNMLQNVQQFALQDPELYSPDVISGYSNFFNNNMKDIMNQYFGENA
jgi:hypothetical protein